MILAMTTTSANLETRRWMVFSGQSGQVSAGVVFLTVVPVLGAGERLGTLVLESFAREFDDDDLVLAEYAATLIGMRIYRLRSERIEEETRKRTAVQMAMDTLSYSEQEAVEHILTS